MNNKQITLTFPKDGGPMKVEVDGCTGESCKDLTRAIEQAVGTEAEAPELKDEYHQREAQIENEQQQGLG